MRPKALGGYPEITLELWHRDIIAAWRWPEALTRVYEHSTTILHYCAPAEMSSSSTHIHIYMYVRVYAKPSTLPPCRTLRAICSRAQLLTRNRVDRIYAYVAVLPIYINSLPWQTLPTFDNCTYLYIS